MAVPTLNDHYAQADMKANYGAVGQAVKVETELDVARSAFQQSRELSNYVHSIVNRLCGCQPEAAPDGISGKDYDPEGLFPQIAQEARRSMSEMSSAMAALRRLERVVS